MINVRFLCAMGFTLVCTFSAAQITTPSVGADPDPILRVEFEETEAIPGQPLSLRLTVLVPTNLISPPVWPTLETPNLLVRLPERSTGPTSERIDGETWAGVTRRYLISPMVPGEFSLAPQQVSITWNAPSGDAPIETTLTTDAFAFKGIVPDGAEGLDPFFAAQGLELTSQVMGDAEAMDPGDSLKWTITAAVEGTSPMFLPPLIEVPSLPGLKAYPEDPVLDEQDDRGKLTGTRTETVTFVAEGGGTGAVPEVALTWFNIATGKIETVTTPSVAYEIDGPAATALSAPRDIRRTAFLGGVVVLGLVALWLVWRLVSPRLRRALTARRAAYLASEDYAWSQLQNSLKAQDHATLYPALDLWAERHIGPDPRTNPDVKSALNALGRASFGAGGVADASSGWTALSDSLHRLRRTKSATQKAQVLPPLNPRPS